jgi:16S rRNA (cytosine967-C5)-methyltransferase
MGDARLMAHLLVAAYQILLLDRTPVFAAVDAAVESVGRARGSRVSGFANAVLRRLADQHRRLDATAATVENAPAWLVRRLERVIGQQETLALLGAVDAGGLRYPVPTLRLVEGRTIPEWLAGAPVGRLSPRARRFLLRGDPRKRPGWADGAFVVQEEGAQVVALALGARPGERVLDACAGRGQKATLLAEQVGENGEVFACDVHPAKLSALAEEFCRLGLRQPRTCAVDWSVGSGDAPGGFDRVLVDAPCTGTGTLRRRPETLLRLGEDDPRRLAELSASILRRAAERVRPGGRVVFAVCSVLPEEGERVIERLGALLEPTPFDAPELPPWVEQSSSFRLLPVEHGTDGFFVASLRRRGVLAAHSPSCAS